MRYALHGNTGKETLWKPVAQLLALFEERAIAYCLHSALAEGLAARDLWPAERLHQCVAEKPTPDTDVVLSFGGDGTLLHTVHQMHPAKAPVLGVNIGRLGFLADIEVGQLGAAIDMLEAGDFRIEERSLLGITSDQALPTRAARALNEVVFARGGYAGLLTVDVFVDGVFLNAYWADGVLIATPTGSTAYSLSVGGPIMAPGCGAVVVSPIAPHTLTVRPIVLPDTAEIVCRVRAASRGFVLAVDGHSVPIDEARATFTITRSTPPVRLVKLPEQHYFETLRSKLMWGASKASPSP